MADLARYRTDLAVYKRQATSKSIMASALTQIAAQWAPLRESIARWRPLLKRTTSDRHFRQSLDRCQHAWSALYDNQERPMAAAWVAAVENDKRKTSAAVKTAYVLELVTLLYYNECMARVANARAFYRPLVLRLLRAESMPETFMPAGADADDSVLVFVAARKSTGGVLALVVSRALTWEALRALVTTTPLLKQLSKTVGLIDDHDSVVLPRHTLSGGWRTPAVHRQRLAADVMQWPVARFLHPGDDYLCLYL
jgi:hypothetical protein